MLLKKHWTSIGAAWDNIYICLKIFTECQSMYSNIECESIQRVHIYIYARRFPIVTDHKPSINITDNSIHSASPRLQRMIIQIHGYNCTVIYRPGKEMILADTRSRSPNTKNNSSIQFDPHVDDIDIQLEDSTYITMALINFSKPKQHPLKDETASYPILRELMNTIVTGWPDCIKQLPADYEYTGHYVMSWLLKQAWFAMVVKTLYLKPFRQQSCNNCIYVIPDIVKTHQLARGTVYWPNIHEQIERHVEYVRLANFNNQLT